MKRLNPFDGMRISLFDLCFSTIETANAVKERTSDLFTAGVVDGLTVFSSGTQSGYAAFTAGTAYDNNGERIEVPALQDRLGYSNAALNATAASYDIALRYSLGNDGTYGLDVNGASQVRHYIDSFNVVVAKVGADTLATDDVQLARVTATAIGSSLIFDTNFRDTMDLAIAGGGADESMVNLTLSGFLTVGGPTTLNAGVTANGITSTGQLQATSVMVRNPGQDEKIQFNSTTGGTIQRNTSTGNLELLPQSGSSVQVTGTLAASGNIQATTQGGCFGTAVINSAAIGSATVTDQLNVAGDTELAGTLLVDSNADVGSLSVVDNATVGGVLEATTQGGCFGTLVVNSIAGPSGITMLGGRLGINTRSPASQIHAITDEGISGIITHRRSVDSSGSSIAGRKTRGPNGNLDANDVITSIAAQTMDNGVNFRNTAEIRFVAAAAHSAGSVPANIIFLTCPSGGVSTLTRMTISEAGLVTVAGTLQATTEGACFGTLVATSAALPATVMSGLAESVRSQLVIYGASAAGSDTYAITPSPAFTAYSTGMVIAFKADVANTGAATINVNGLGAKSLKAFFNGAKADLPNTHIAAGQIVAAIYDGTDFLIINEASAVNGFSAYRTTNQTGLATATFTKMQFTSEAYDINGEFDSVTNHRFTPTKAGKYFLIAASELDSLGDGKRTVMAIFKNGSDHKRGISLMNGAVGNAGSVVACVVEANGSGDYFEAHVWHENGSNRDLIGTEKEFYFQGFRILS